MANLTNCDEGLVTPRAMKDKDRMLSTKALSSTLTGMGRRATPLKMKDFAVTFTLTVMRNRTTPLIMKDYSVTSTLTTQQGL